MLNKESWYNNLKTKNSKILYERLVNLYSSGKSSHILNEALTFQQVLNNIATIVQAPGGTEAKVTAFKNFLKNTNNFTNLKSDVQATFTKLDDWFESASQTDANKWIDEYQNSIASGKPDKSKQLRMDPDIVKSSTPPTPAPRPRNSGATPPPAAARTNISVIEEWIGQNTAKFKNIAESAKSEQDYFQQLNSLFTNSGVVLPSKLTADESLILINSIVNASGNAGLKYKKTVMDVIGEALKDKASSSIVEWIKDRHPWLRAGVGLTFVAAIIASGGYYFSTFNERQFYVIHKCKNIRSTGWIDEMICNDIREKNPDASWATVEEPTESAKPQLQTPTKDEIQVGDMVMNPKYPDYGCYKVKSVSDDKKKIVIIHPKTKEEPESEQKVNTSAYTKCERKK